MCIFKSVDSVGFRSVMFDMYH